MFTKNKIIWAILALTMCFTSVNAWELDNVVVLDKNTIGLSNSIAQVSEISNNSKIKLLEEVKIFDDLVDSSVNTVVLYLEDVLEKSDKTYSLFSANSTWAYIDFVYNTDDWIFEYDNTDQNSDISYISIVDSSFIELRFKNDVLENYDFSMIKEADITNIVNGQEYLLLDSNIDLLEWRDYLLTFVELFNKSWESINLQEEVISFKAQNIPEEEYLEEIINEEKVPEELITEEVNTEEIAPENLVPEELITEEVNTEEVAPENLVSEELIIEDNIDLNSAEEMNLESEQNEESNLAVDIEQVAMDVESTPATWAETWILILLTVLFSSYIFLRKNLKA